jgi:3-oxoadipate enol-lactonase
VVNVAGRGEMFVREADGPNGGGPTILLMHGWTASADLNWFPLYQPLSRIGRVLAVDHRGHGRGIRTAERFTLEDCADDAAGLVRQLGLGPVIVVGYSMGGPISLLFWKRHPELVSGLVLEATALEWRASLWERFIWRFMSLMELGLRLGPSERLVAKFLRDEAKQRPEIIEFRGWFEGEIRRGDPAAQADAGRALSTFDARPFAGTIDVPAAVVVTTRDRLVRPKKQRALAKAIPGAAVFELAGDHDAPLVKPAELTRVTESAIAAVTKKATAPLTTSPRHT